MFILMKTPMAFRRTRLGVCSFNVATSRFVPIEGDLMLNASIRVLLKYPYSFDNDTHCQMLTIHH